MDYTESPSSRTPEQRANGRRWVAALRSGEWRQCRSIMHRDDAHCCLGVAQRVIAPEVSGYLTSVGHIDHQPMYDAVRERLGLSIDLEGECVSANDIHKKTFPEIADMVEPWFAEPS